MAGKTTLDGLIDEVKLTNWLDEHIPELGSGPLTTKMIHGGTSNVIVSLNRGRDTTMILRRPPVIPPPNSEKSIMREARVLTALNGTPVPHPHCYGSCDDLSVIGAPFYVMELVDGWAGELRDGHIYHKAPFDQPPYEYGLIYAMTDGMVALANVEYKAVGLEGFGKAGGYLERQVDRWAWQLGSYKELYGYPGRELPGYDLAEAWLRANVPSDEVVGIMHCDLGTPNVLFADGPPARLTAMIDWELSTIGDPMMDLGLMSTALRDEREPDRIPERSLYNAENMPTRQEIARYYAAGTGRDVSNLDYYIVLAQFRNGCLLEYKVAQAMAGMLPQETGEMFHHLVLGLFADAARVIKRMG